MDQSMKVLYDLKDILIDELKDYNRKEDLTDTDVGCIYKMIDIVKDISTIEAMERYGYNEYSNRSYSEAWPMTTYPRMSFDGRMGMDGDGDGRYSEENSYRRGMSNRYSGRGSSYNGYSGHGKEQIVEDLRVMMADARTEDERERYRKAIDTLNRQ